MDGDGRLIGILTRRYEGFGRAVPIECVKELLGDAALDVQFDPQVAPEDGGQVRVTVTPRGPVLQLARAYVSLVGDQHQSVRMKPDSSALSIPLRPDPLLPPLPQHPITKGPDTMTTRPAPSPTIDQPARPAIRQAQPISLELADDLARLQREQQIELDRQRQAELAQLRAIQSYD